VSLAEVVPHLDHPEAEERLLLEEVLAATHPLATWEEWLRGLFPASCTHPFGSHHVEFWEWLWSIETGVRPDPFVAIWARGGAKSTSAELGAVALGARGQRCYGLYVCDTQDRADDHVGNIAALLESKRVALAYPALAARRIGKHGNSRGWRRNRLWTADGFVIDAIGLDTAARGVKLEDQRPDLLVLDDVDGLHDTVAATARKVETLTRSVIPAGSDDVAVLAIQNLVIPDGVFAQLADGRAEFLRRRQVSGPVPALRDMRVERVDGADVIVAGEPTWAGQSLAVCQAQADDWGLRSFIAEAQHEVGDAPGALWCRPQIDAGRIPGEVDMPTLDTFVVSVDPSGGAGKGHDEQGIVGVGRCGQDAYVVADASCSLSAGGWGKRAVSLAVDLGADRIIVEDNYGGDSMLNTVRLAADALVREGVAGAAKFGSDHPAGVVPVNASGRSKADRAKPVSFLYGEKERAETWPDAQVHHVGHFPELEREMTGWDPATTAKSPNRLDALVHAVTDLGLVARGKGRTLRFRGAA
jgi:hypothetical protein